MIPEPKRKAEIVINPLRLDPAHGWEFTVVCDVEHHAAIAQMPGVSNVMSFDSGKAWITVDERYSAHEVYVYVGCQLTAMSKEAKLIRQVDEVIEQSQ